MAALVQQLVPEGVVVVEGPILTSEIRLSDAEMALIAHAVPSRRLEFLTGRLYARKALASQGIHDYPLLSGARREPIWPNGVVGSVSHSATWCAVAIGSVAEVAGLGIDIEDLPLAAESAELAGDVAHPAELDVLRAAGVDDPLALAFSAKESVYKARLADRVLEFADVVIGSDDEGLVAQVCSDVPSSSFRLRWAVGGSRVATVATAMQDH